MNYYSEPIAYTIFVDDNDDGVNQSHGVAMIETRCGRGECRIGLVDRGQHTV